MGSESLTTWQIFVSGKVQGVGYRRFAQKTASELGVRGWTRNLRDQRVEILAQGDEATLERFLFRLREGPALAKVTETQVHQRELSEHHTGFEITQDGE